ncbi:replication initiation protein [Deinococcus radiophilus]|nr:replication initiation protein [Deinococcus radiophilus]UFA51937.1 replication initiation protein [Deinococcus radiophilus]
MLTTTAARHVALHGFSHYRTDTPLWIPVLPVDMDGNDPIDLIMAGVRIPYPTWVVYNNANGHAWAMYALIDPIVCSPKSARIERYAALIRDGLCLVLGGDPNYTNTTARTPWHDGHTYYPVLHRRWELRELAALLPLDSVARRTASPRRPLDPTAGRNSGLFARLGDWARQEAREGRYGRLSYDQLHAVAAGLNSTLGDPLPAGEVRSTARSVWRWMQADWQGNRTATPNAGSTRSQIRSHHREQLNTQQARERIQAAQAKGAQTRGEATREAITQAVGQLVASGQRVTRQGLQQLTGISERTLSRHTDIWKR